MRLIDADKLTEQLRESDRGCPNDIIKGCIGLVQTQPTAHSVEAVVAELEDKRKEAKQQFDKYEDVYQLGKMLGFDTALEIVRNGGKE